MRGKCGGCSQVIDFIGCGGLRRFDAAVAAVARNILKTLVRRFCGGSARETPIPPIRSRYLSKREAGRMRSTVEEPTFEENDHVFAKPVQHEISHPGAGRPVLLAAFLEVVEPWGEA